MPELMSLFITSLSLEESNNKDAEISGGNVKNSHVDPFSVRFSTTTTDIISRKKGSGRPFCGLT